MKEIIIASTNPAKIFQIKSALKLAGIEASGPEKELPEVIEDGKTLIDNAIKKAKSAAKFLNKTILAMDNGLYFDDLEESKQPGLKIRRIPGFDNKRPSDEEILKYYLNLIKSLGNKIGGYYRYGICVAIPEGKTWTTVIESRRTFVSKPYAKIVGGYPIESLSIDPKSGKYIAQMNENEKEIFWQKNIGEVLSEFIKSIEI
ncbi:MAG: non-canonical purine NTP pyrophosphatase [Candidatus Shapirobacteria bacterium]